MVLDISIQVWRRRDRFVAKCPELDFVSQGASSEEARQNLLEVIQIQWEEMTELGTLDEYLSECGYQRHDDWLVPQTEMVGFEKRSVQIV